MHYICILNIFLYRPVPVWKMFNLQRKLVLQLINLSYLLSKFVQPPSNFSMEHLLHRIRGVDAPGCTNWRARFVSASLRWRHSDLRFLFTVTCRWDTSMSSHRKYLSDVTKHIIELLHNEPICWELWSLALSKLGYTLTCSGCRWQSLNRREKRIQFRHCVVSLRQHGFLVLLLATCARLS